MRLFRGLLEYLRLRRHYRKYPVWVADRRGVHMLTYEEARERGLL